MLKERHASSEGQKQDKDVCRLLWLLTNIILTILAKKIKHEDEIKAIQIRKESVQLYLQITYPVYRKSQGIHQEKWIKTEMYLMPATSIFKIIQTVQH